MIHPAMLLNPLHRRVRTHRGLPVMPGRFPVVGHMPAIMMDPASLIDRGVERFGSLFWIDPGFGRDMDLVYALPDVFELFRSDRVESSHFLEDMPLFFGHSLLVVDGAVHRHMRSAMSTSFTPRGLHRNHVSRVAKEAIEACVRGWVQQREVTILRQTQELTLRIIFEVIGVPDHEISEWRAQFRRFMLSAIHLPVELPGSPHWVAKRARSWINDRLRALIEAARRDPEMPGLLAALVRGRDEEGLALSELELLDNLRLLVLAGHETSASALAWMMIYLAHHPACWDALCEEARRVNEIPCTPEALAECPLAEGLFREAVRMRPPIYAESRRTTDTLVLDGHEIAPGTVIHMPLTRLSRDPTVHPRPERFEPQRWFQRDHKITPLETSQFGGGHHFCLGYHLAVLEGTQLAIAAARILGAAGLRPVLRPDRLPRTVFMPLAHPPARTRIHFEPARS